MVVGFAWLTRIGAQSNYWAHVFGPGCIISLAIGLLFTPLASAATTGVHFTEAGLASGVLNTARQMGGSLGLAILATIAIDHTHAILGGAHASASPSAAAAALTAGYARAFGVAAVFGVRRVRRFVHRPLHRAQADRGRAGCAHRRSVGRRWGGSLPTLDPAQRADVHVEPA